MKKLTKIKLINWHYFINETITIEGNVLLTGENGTGKSTVLDALQFVLTAGKQKFNTAANEKASRDLIGYVRCKTGFDLNQYARVGDVTSHVALEFFDENKKSTFIIGTVIDSASNLSNPKYIFYRIEGKLIADALFLDQETPRNINNFKIYLNNLKAYIMKTQEQARKDFCHRFGSLNHRFVDLIPKALAFRPINNVKDFVYSYILDKKEIYIDYFKENIRTVTEFENLLKQVKVKVTQLEAISEIFDKIKQVEENRDIQEYIIKRTNKEINLIDIENKEKAYHKLILDKELTERSKLNLNQELTKERDYLQDLERTLATNDNYQLLKDLHKEKSSLENQLAALINVEKALDEKLTQLYANIYKLNTYNVNLPGMDKIYQYRNKEINEANIQDLLITLDVLNTERKKMHEELIYNRANLLHKRDLERNKIAEVNEDISILQKKQLIYPDYVMKLKNAIHTELKKVLGKDIRPKVLCELLYMKDETWQEAVEGYLNTQRFNLIVEPEYFDLSLRVYEQVKYELNIHTTGLINTQELGAYKSDKENSLAYLVGSENQFAKNYINMILNNVVCCEHVDELKQYPVSITKTCMVYKNKTARQIKKAVYDPPFIGRDAYKKQLAKKLAEKATLAQLINDYDGQIKQIDTLIELFDKLEIVSIRDNLTVKLNIQKTAKAIELNAEKIKEIDSSSFIEIEINIQKIKETVKTLETRLTHLAEKIGSINSNIVYKNSEVNEARSKQTLLETELKAIERKILAILNKAEERYIEAIKNKDLNTVNTNYERQLSNSETRIINLLSDLRVKQTDYNRDHHFGAATGIDGMEVFYAELDKLKTSQIVIYEEKIREAKKKAEEQFQDEFLSKLQENILNAQREFDKLNDALKGITFGEDRYNFVYYDDKNSKKLYDMIMDNSNIGGKSLFSESFKEKHQEALDELFDQISLDNEASKLALDKYTDYRSYMDYDIKIINNSGSTASFSKVGREKSGGETQTPYYVAIAASFIQLYNSYHNDSIGLILFDEAFDKMDEQRIESMMVFLNKLNLQVILAAPPQKLESIAPNVETTLIVSRKEDVAFIEAFHHE